jgi:hypothetical protein
MIILSIPKKHKAGIGLQLNNNSLISFGFKNLLKIPAKATPLMLLSTGNPTIEP